MPDSQLPPLWGPGYDERDLDALLSGVAGSTPVALQPVESTLTALRAAATRRELSDEAAARAAFRAFAAAPAPSAPAGTWTTEAQHPPVTAHTLVLPSADGRTNPAARHRHRHRRSAPRARRRPSLAMTGAAAALIVVAAAVTGALTGSIGDLTSFGHRPAGATASARASRQSSGSQRVLGSAATSKPTTHPAASVSASAWATGTAPSPPGATSGPGSLCRDYFEYFEHPAKGDGTDRIALRGELSKLAGGRFKVFGYCLRYLNPSGDKAVLPPDGTYPVGRQPWGRGNPGAGSPGGDQGAQTGGLGQGGSSGATGFGPGGVGGR